MRLIDADALTKRIDEAYPSLITPVSRIKWIIGSCPIVDAVPVVKGKWINTGDGLYTCSKCGVIDHREPKHNYCPNCGTKNLTEDDRNAESW